MARRGVSIKSDGNGGLDVNVQKAILRKWGPLGLAAFLVLSGLGAKFGEEAWSMVLERRQVSEKVSNNTREIMELREDLKEWKAEIREDISEIKDAVEQIAAQTGDDNG